MRWIPVVVLSLSACLDGTGPEDRALVAGGAVLDFTSATSTSYNCGSIVYLVDPPPADSAICQGSDAVVPLSADTIQLVIRVENDGTATAPRLTGHVTGTSSTCPILATTRCESRAISTDVAIDRSQTCVVVAPDALPACTWMVFFDLTVDLPGGGNVVWTYHQPVWLVERDGQLAKASPLGIAQILPSLPVSRYQSTTAWTVELRG